jgi:hypothetical protein
MELLPRLLAVLALALQAALGSAHLTLEVCHGEVQLPASDGSPCCSHEQHDEGDDDSQSSDPAQLNAECEGCFDIEPVGSDDPVEVPSSTELPAPPTFVAVAATESPGKVLGLQRAPLIARGPPDSLTPTGLLPGVFPLRI